ncbi:MAG: FtsX-like permease family protein, partial [bacterium]|nr:FtsX-like permease family protein [bacterium]
YVLTQKESDLDQINTRMENYVKEHDPETSFFLSLQSLKDIHLRSVLTWDFDNYSKSNIKYIYIFSVIAVCVLLIASINFMNLSTARSGKRSKEIGMRKVHGAYRSDLVKQFFVESFLLSLTALVIALFLVVLTIPVFNGLSGKDLDVNAIADPLLILSFFALMTVTGFISGIYPSLYLSSFQPVKVIKGISGSNIRFGANLRKTLVVLQFGLSIILILATTVIYNQLDYVRNKPLGFDKENILSLDSTGGFRSDGKTVKQELLKNPGVKNVSWSIIPNGYIEPTTDISWEGKDPNKSVMMYRCLGDYDYLKTFGLEMAEGRFFSKEHPSDRTNYILNEAAVKAIGINSPVGKSFTFRGNEGTIIGIVRDFHQGSLHSEIKPILMTYMDNFFSVHIKIGQENTAQTIDYIEGVWEKFVPGRPFSYRFVEDIVNNFYRSEAKTGNLLKYFTFIAILISCLGLFGLASYSAEQRTKEVGIRKTLGASDLSVIRLLAADFVKWVGVAALISCPPAVYIMNKWLQNFAYKNGIGISLVSFTIALVMIIALLTVSFQSFKAARSKPVDSLRYE